MIPVRAHAWGSHVLRRFARQCDQWRFSRFRGDYYEYLAALMHGMQGRETLRDHFLADALRYGSSTVRGRLSALWAQTYQASGGDLGLAWLDSFPQGELVLIRAGQSLGNTALLRTLRDLAGAVELMRKARAILSSTLWAAVAGLLVVCAMVLAVPLFTLPRLLQTFEALPAQYHGPLTRQLSVFSDFVGRHYGLMGMAAACALAFFVWSFANTTGSLRRRLDHWGPWRIYRAVHGLRLLAMLSVSLECMPRGSTELRSALLLQRQGAQRWHGGHLDAMLLRMSAGETGGDIFDTGLLDQDLLWFLTDMVRARGLIDGLRLTRLRLERRVLESISRQAHVLRWAALLMSVSCLLGLALWHYGAIDELRRGLMSFYASP